MSNRSSNRNAHQQGLYRPPKTAFLKSVKELFWNSREKTCCTRTPLNWLCISIYYVIFLSCILGIMFGVLELVKSLASEERPMFVLDESPIGSTPQLNSFPHYKSSPLIWVTTDNDYNEKSKKAIEEVFKPYKSCGTSCSFKIAELGECQDYPYGYDKSILKPCVFLRVNRLIEWKPQPYTTEAELPPALKGKDVSKGLVWVVCQGTDRKDKEHLKNYNFIFEPEGFDPKHFPYKRSDKYLDPIVSFKMDPATLPKNILLSLTCTLWAKNVVPEDTAVEILLNAD